MPRTAARTITVDRSALLDFIRPRHHGILVTSRQDSRPQLSPVTMGVDGDGHIVVSTYPERAKARNAARNPRASVCVLSDSFNDDWVQVDGQVELIRQPEALDGLVEYFRCISGEHPDWEEYRHAMAEQGKVLLRVSIERWSPISRGGFPVHILAND